MTEAFNTGERASTTDNVTAYLRRGDYEQVNGAFATYKDICEVLSLSEGPTVIGVDGPTTGGKTSFSHALVAYYEERGIPVTHLPLDYFLKERGERANMMDAVTQGELAISDYSLEAWAHEDYHDTLERAIDVATNAAGNPKEFVITNAYNRATGMKDQTVMIPVHPGGVIIAEGVGMHAFYDEVLDTKIRVEAEDGILVARIVKREQYTHPEKRLSEAFLLRRYRVIDEPHTALLRLASAGRADVVIDTTEINAMKMYKKIPSFKAHSGQR